MSQYHYQQRHQRGDARFSVRPSADAMRQTEEVQEEEEDDRLYELRPRSSVRRYVPQAQPQQQQRAIRRQGRRDVIVYHGETEAPPPVMRRRAAMRETSTQEYDRPVRQERHALFYVGVGMVVLTVLAIGLFQLVSWWQVYQDDLHYGRPRTFQCDAVVGQNHDSAEHPSHFLAVNLNRHVLIIELPAGDASHAHIYSGPVLLGEGQDLSPVTLSFQDVTGDGKPDMLVHIDGSQIVFVNDGNAFRPQQPGDHLTE